MKTDTALLGAAGEHLVLSRLLLRGFLAAQAPHNVRKADILVNHLDSKPPCLIQVKARSGKGSDGGWHMKQKHEDIRDKDMFYCFVDFGVEPSKVYVIPANKVAEVVRDSHAIWLAKPGKDGKKHNDSDMRRIRNEYSWDVPSVPKGWMDKYLEHWELLE